MKLKWFEDYPYRFKINDMFDQTMVLSDVPYIW